MTAFLAAIASAAVVLGFITAILGFLSQRAARRAAREAAATAGKVQEISVNVDGRLSEMIDRQAQLLGALHASGTPVPDRPEKTLAESLIPKESFEFSERHARADFACSIRQDPGALLNAD